MESKGGMQRLFNSQWTIDDIQITYLYKGRNFCQPHHSKTKKHKWGKICPIFLYFWQKGLEWLCPSSTGPHKDTIFAECSTVKLGDKERLNKEQLGIKEFLSSWEMLEHGVSEREIIKISKKGTLENVWTHFGILHKKGSPEFIIVVFHNFL